MEGFSQGKVFFAFPESRGYWTTDVARGILPPLRLLSGGFRPMRPLIIWDNDGVLVDTEKLYFQATRETLVEVGYDLTPDIYREHFLASSQGTWHLMRQEGTAEQEITRLRAVRDERYLHLIGTEEIEVDGAEDVLRELHGDHRMAVATSTRLSHFELIHARTGFSSYFELVVTADEVPATKPDPALYRRAVERLGAAPEDCVAFEDSERGLRAAKAAGLRCWVLPSALGVNADWSEADGVLDDIAQVPAVMASLGY